MKQIITSLVFIALSILVKAQYETIFHSSGFKKFKGIMQSNPYRPDKSEKPFMEASVKSIFPSDVKKDSGAYIDTPIHWIGIVKDVVIQDSNDISAVLFTLEQKYWDYIEDYSVQDEVVFVSPEGEGDFRMLVQLKLTDEEREKIKKMPGDKTLLFCYGRIISDNDLPVLKAGYIKIVDYKYYSTNIFSYKVKRDSKGQVAINKRGGTELDDFKFLRVAKPGQNKD